MPNIMYVVALREIEAYNFAKSNHSQVKFIHNVDALRGLHKVRLWVLDSAVHRTDYDSLMEVMLTRPIEVVRGVERGSLWQHKVGGKYLVLNLTNVHAVHPGTYKVTVVYQDEDGLIWSRPLSDWHRSMTRVRA